ncbi:hypothetical protein B0T18DRAFT_328666 [Schizothecium vesticola]|uniref:Uncharacterized protein n=1 Tax=Schizothecium vesticola TaxID=314040 RepID=A0AA40K2V6_9PEZI|nr:hypothetical protein B0T18DRAFT_328666 [Schizothecium vesticola]
MEDAPPIRPPVPSHLAEHEDDENGYQKGYVRGTDYSLPYYSRWSRMHEAEIYEDLLRHVNCGYLSTRGVPPTLLALKQHAQSLCILIHALNPTLEAGEIVLGDPSQLPPTHHNVDVAPVDDPLAFKHQLNDAFDFLNDLSQPYTNDDPNHNKPLTGLVNEVRSRHEAYGTAYHCPLDEHTPRGATEKQRPYANHQSLLRHANALLERLDHETSSTGGLLSLLPTSSEADALELSDARNSLLGQWLLFTQHLVARGHELELQLANALDALASEALVPQHYVGTLGADALAGGNAIAFPQDRFVLANAGDDVFDHLHAILDKQEALIQAKAAVWAKQGVIGKRIYQRHRGGEEHARGLVPVTIPTRYYRLAGQGRNTIFVVPAWDNHPGVAGTREAEDKPQIVACVQPRYPPRVSELEKKYDERIGRAVALEAEVRAMRAEQARRHDETSVLEEENRQLAETRDALLLAVGKSKRVLAEEVQRERARAVDAEGERERVKEERDAVVRERDQLELQLSAAMREAAQGRVSSGKGKGKGKAV